MPRPFKIALLLAALVIIAIITVLPAIFSVNKPDTSLRIDRSTPAVQKGFTIVDVGVIGANGHAICHWPDTTPYLLRLIQQMAWNSEQRSCRQWVPLQ